MTPTEESFVLEAGIRYFDFAPDLREKAESTFAAEPVATAGDRSVDAPRAPLSDEERRFGAFLAVARLMANFRRQVDSLVQ